MSDARTRVRRTGVQGLAITAMTAALCAAAADYPLRPIRLLVPFPPGGSVDTVSRIVTPKLAESMGQQWVVDNRGGAAGNIAVEIVAKASPDGYTALLALNTMLTVNPGLYRNLPFDVARDFRAVSQLAATQYTLVLHPAVAANSVSEFVALAKAKPGQLNYSSSGVGNPMHLAAELFRIRAGIDLVHVPYKGGGPAAAAVLGGEVQLLFGSVAMTMPQVRAGKLKALATTGPKRSPVAPGLPTLEESGFPGFSVTSWIGLLVPAKTADAVVQRLHREIIAALKLADVREAMARQGLEITTNNSPAEFTAQIGTETKVWAEVIKTAGIHAQ